MRRKFAAPIEEGKAAVYQWDARDMASIEDGSIDRIITDPPWGIYDGERYGDIQEFYNEFMREFVRVLRPGGTLTLLSAAKVEAMRAARAAGLRPEGRLDILVNGKKAALLRCRKPLGAQRFERGDHR